jgi:transcriptional repressor NrdR
MKCPSCGHPEDKVTDSREIKDGAGVRRRRECLECGHRFTTYEYVEEAPLMILKRDGRREAFNREKLRRGIQFACAKRPIPADTIDQISIDIEEKCHELGVREVPADRIGDMVMTRLKALDEVAYIRFASVYRRFQDAGEFRKELESM